jgi:hypothetical protein
VKPRLLGHWGTTPGLNFMYAHLNRVIRKFDLDTLFICGPGHGGPAMVANTYLEGTYTEVYPHITQDADGLRRLFRQFSFPGGIPSHAAPETPGSIHEGGELGYALAHAYGAAFDNPDLPAGDGAEARSRDAETCFGLPSLKWLTRSSPSSQLPLGPLVPRVRIVVSGLARFIILLFALVVASDARRRMYGVEGWGRHLRCGSRAAGPRKCHALTHPSNLVSSEDRLRVQT